jgi:TolB-like protein/Flp pilus assembly protein TadD
MPLETGEKLGPYEILTPLGEGGMGEVWKARDTRLNRLVAIKRLKGSHSMRFVQEARAIAAVNHPNICQIYDIGPDYLVLEYVEGSALKGPLANSEVAKIALDIAGALEAAHARGILHCDLKPGNILMTPGGCKLLDFGVARLTGDSDSDATRTLEGTIAGTVAYMSPEQANGQTVDPRSDIFSFGAVLYEMISGRRAFPGESMMETLSAVVHSEPPTLDSPLANVVSRCLMKRPDSRFQSAVELKMALSGSPAAGPAGVIDSIAVLPFTNNGNDPDTEYLCEGIAENIMNTLAQAPRLRVAPRSVVFRFKSQDADPQAIGRQLGVRAVLTGRVRQRGDNLLVAAELVDVAAGAQLWGERFQRKIADLFELEEEIAVKIAQGLRAKMSRGDATARPKRFTSNTEAYQLYLRGRHHWTRRTPAELIKAREYFQQAIDKDPGYALAYSGLADCYSILSLYSVLPQKDAFLRAKAAAVAATAFDDELAEAQASRAFVRAYFEYDWKGAEADLQRAHELNPSYWVTPYWRALILNSLGRYDEAEQRIQQALELEPLSPTVMHMAIAISYYAGRFEQAIERGMRGIESPSPFFFIHYWLGLAFEAVGRQEEAVSELEKAAEMTSPAVSFVMGGLAHVYVSAGRRGEAEMILRELLGLGEHGVVDAVGFATTYLALGDSENALQWIERGVEARGILPCMIKGNPHLNPLRGAPRFQEALRRMNLA